MSAPTPLFSRREEQLLEKMALAEVSVNKALKDLQKAELIQKKMQELQEKRLGKLKKRTLLTSSEKSLTRKLLATEEPSKKKNIAKALLTIKRANTKLAKELERIQKFYHSTYRL